jgi:hypothetical protein
MDIPCAGSVARMTGFPFADRFECPGAKQMAAMEFLVVEDDAGMGIYHTE